MSLNTLHFYIIAVAVAAISISGICLLTVAMPRDNGLRNYRISRRMLGIGYLAYSLASLSAVVFGLSHTTTIDPVLLVTTIVTCLIMSLVVAFTLMTLLNPMFPTFRKIAAWAVPILLLTGLLVFSLAARKTALFRWVYYASYIFFLLQMIVYTVMMRREYRGYVAALSNYFSDLEDKRLKWINTAFFMALALGIATAASLFLPPVYFVIITGFVTFFFVFYAIRYIGYTKVYRKVAAALEPVSPREEAVGVLQMESVQKRVDDWIARKGFVSHGFSIESLAAELGVHRTLLAHYINKHVSETFKRWITGLRIEEARELLLEDPRRPLAQVAESVGIRNRAMFFRSFRRVTGEDPRDFRDRMIKVMPK